VRDDVIAAWPVAALAATLDARRRRRSRFAL
jgi:hypothetical protein